MVNPESYVGKQIDQFRLDQYIAQGAMGMVYKATDTILNRTVALKLIPKKEEATSAMAEARKRLIAEAQAAGRLAHPNIVTIHAYGETEDFQYICMEYVIGRTLAQLLDARKVLDVEEAVALFEQVLLALDAAHQEKIVHRDIKPTNIMIMKGNHVKVMDFGIAKLPSMDMTTTGTVLGTPYYMSPEQISGQKVDIRSDIFSVGAVLYQVLTGHRPFDGDSTVTLVYKIIQVEPIPPKVLNAHVPPALERVCKKALAKDPGQRYQNPAEMLEGLKAAMKAGAPEPPPDELGVTVKARPAEPEAPIQAPEETVRTTREALSARPPKKRVPPPPGPEETMAEQTAPPKAAVPPPTVKTAPKPPREPERKGAAGKMLAAAVVLAVALAGGGMLYFRGQGTVSGPGRDGGARDETVRPEPPKPEPAKVEPVRVEPPKTDGGFSGKRLDDSASKGVGKGDAPGVEPPADPFADKAGSRPAPSQEEQLRAAVESLMAEAKGQAKSNPAGAQKLLEKATAMDPNHVEALLQLAGLLTVKKDYNAAIEHYRKVIKINNKLPEAHFNLGFIYLSQGKIDQAIESYEACWALSPRYQDEVLTNLGISYLKKNDTAQAQLFFKQALKANPKNAVARKYLDSTATAIHDPAQDAVQAKAVDAKVAASVESLIVQAKGQMKTSPANAQKFLEIALTLEPDNYEATVQLARVMLGRKDYSGAIEQYRKALKINGNADDIYFNLGFIYLSQGKIDQAIESYEACRALSPQYQDQVLTNLGISYLKKNDTARAQALFNEALELNPKNDIARNYLRNIGG